MSDPERNIQVGCWYLEKLREPYRGRPAETAMTLAAYNAGPSRVDDWTKETDTSSLPAASKHRSALNIEESNRIPISLTNPPIKISCFSVRASGFTMRRC